MPQSFPPRTKLAALVVILLLFASVSSFLLWAIVGISEIGLPNIMGGKPLPFITQMCFKYRLVFLLLPAPWLVLGAILVGQKSDSAFSLIAFASTLVMALLSATILVFTALAVPWMPIPISMGH